MQAIRELEKGGEITVEFEGLDDFGDVNPEFRSRKVSTKSKYLNHLDPKLLKRAEVAVNCNARRHARKKACISAAVGLPEPPVPSETIASNNNDMADNIEKAGPRSLPCHRKA